MDAQEYMTSRVEDQIAWYDKKSQWNQKRYKGLRMTEFVLAASIPFLAGLVTLHWSLPLVVGAVGIAIAVITAALGLYQYEKNWIEYRTTCESLRKERLLFLTRTSPYDGKEATNLANLVHRVESLTSKENTTWAQYMQETEKEGAQNGTPKRARRSKVSG